MGFAYGRRRRLPGLLAVSLAVWIVLGSVTSVRAATPEQIDDAKARAVRWLYSQQKPEGIQWETVPVRAAGGQAAAPHQTTGGQWGGRTAIATYALLAAGENPRDPRLVKAVEWLRGAEIVGNYALAMRAQVWLYLPPIDENRRAMARDADLLAKGVAAEGRFRGTYGYVVGQRLFRFDMSVSQFGVLGMWAVSTALELPRTYWQAVEKAWLDLQQANGGWSYNGVPDAKHPVSPSMTAAGIATLFITQEFLHADAGIQCRGNVTTEAIDKAITHLAGQFPRLVNDAERVSNRLYTLYGVERIGVASGYKYLNDVDWYRVGAEYLVRNQQANGGFGGLPETCFALLFLARGGEPVAMNKARYAVVSPRDGSPADGRWNQRPRDVANAVAYAGRQAERTFNWQIVDLAVADAADLHDAPVLYLAGDQALTLRDDDKRTLRDYVRRGGLILATADCGRTPFVNSVRQLGQELFPPGEFRRLPDDHPILANQQFNASGWRRKPDVFAIGNGSREFVVLVPTADVGRALQRQDFAQEEAFQLVANVMLYAADKTGFRTKGRTHLVTADAAVTPTRQVTVARVRHDGAWDPEPGGWEQFAAVLHNTHRIDLSAEAIDATALGDEGVATRYPVAHLTGTGTLTLTDEARQALARYVRSGGTLVVDAAGGDPTFAGSAEVELTRAFGDTVDGRLAEPLPASHMLYRVGGPSIETRYRTFTRQRFGSLAGPRLRGVEVDGRLAIVYSPEDLSTGLVGMPVDGVIGYTPETATDLMTRIVLNAIGPG